MNTASKLSLALLALTLVGTSVAQAQSASISATATVLAPLTLTGTSDLAFGTVFPGIAKTVAAADAASGRFTIDGNPGSQVSMTFTPTIQRPRDEDAPKRNALGVECCAGGVGRRDLRPLGTLVFILDTRTLPPASHAHDVGFFRA